MVSGELHDTCAASLECLRETRIRFAIELDGDRFAVVTKREEYQTLVQQEIDEPEWRS